MFISAYLSRPEIPILNGFYLTVPAKKTVALVGKNGSGKSRIIPVMERFYDPTLGEVLLDGKNIKYLNLELEWLRSQIGLVTQEPALLNLCIKDNIAYGRSTFEQTIETAKFAHAHTFISSLDKGYETQNGSCYRLDIDQTSAPTLVGLSIGAAVAASTNLPPNSVRTVTFALAWDSPRVKFSTSRTYHWRDTKFYGTDGEAVANIVHAIFEHNSWESQIEEWQQPILQDKRLPACNGATVLNRLT